MDAVQQFDDAMMAHPRALGLAAGGAALTRGMFLEIKQANVALEWGRSHADLVVPFLDEAITMETERKKKMSEAKTTASASGGIGFCGLLTVLFIALKLMGKITWAWKWVLSPLWLPTAIVLAIGLIALVIYLILK